MESNQNLAKVKARSRIDSMAVRAEEEKERVDRFATVVDYKNLYLQLHLMRQ